MADVTVGVDEPFESALRRFNKKVQDSGILREARRRRNFEKPSDKRRREEQARIRKALKKQRRAASAQLRRDSGASTGRR
jgi:small subunit ribosomal protein S21